jgi:serine/threonine protein kinase/formylglycine-generating enzyme required for sulfatase activity
MASDSHPTQLIEESWSKRKERLCDEFEDDWRAGRKPRIEDYIRDLPEPQRGQLLSALLAVELELRVAGREKPTLGEYEGRFPLDGALLRTCFVDAGCIAPEWIDRFQVLRSLGNGSFGRVFLCYDDRLHRQVALKVPRHDRLSTAEARERFLHEARNVAGLRHEAIVTLHEFGETEGQCYLVYEYIAGGNLADGLKQSPLSQYQATKLVERVADALQHAHGEDVYHRDIKPANILLDRRGQPYLTDFGLAVRVEDLADERGRGAGTAPYMAPELVRGDGDQIDGRADIYSLGVVLYELLTGRRPFVGRTQQEIYDQILSGREPRPPREINPGLHPELQEICLKAIARSVSDRYLTAGDLADKLHSAAELLNQPEATPRATPPWPEPPPQPSSSPLPVPVLPKGLRSFGPEDRAFFLELLPGPRDAHRLPESVRFWKLRIESADTDITFPVGLMYGPSGCGKSSLVKAGLLPVLASSVVTVYVEATRENTEERLLEQLRRRCPGLGPRASLRTTFARLRQSRGLPTGTKLLVVLDQFEQWLHAHAHDMETTELAAALRQADGVHVQTLLLVRFDFLMSISRLFESLRINLDRAHNARAVDLFGEGHAHHVLHLFGTAYGQLPPGRADLTKEQTEFLALVVRKLSADGDVIPVRLSLFAEMMRTRPWTLAEFAAVGEMKGIGRKFLEEIFSQPALQASKTAAQAVLQCLLPAPGADLKGRMRSQRELAEHARLAEDSPALAQLLANLNREYLLTPTAGPAPAPGGAEQPENATPGPQDTYYQLTHDYLVPALREWLAEEKARTWTGWAELRLAHRAALWHKDQHNSLLPAWWEWVSFWLLTRPRTWTSPERELMHRASWYQGLRGCVCAVVLALAGWAGIEVHRSLQARTRLSELLAAEMQARTRLSDLLAAEAPEVPERIADLRPYDSWAIPRLVQIAQDTSTDVKKRRNANLALLAAGLADVEMLAERLLTGEPVEVGVIGRALAKYHPEGTKSFWELLDHRSTDAGRRLRAACALASSDPANPHWRQAAHEVVLKVVREPLSLLHEWKRELEPIGRFLVQPLADVLREPKGSESERFVAASLLAHYGRDLPDLLAELVKTVEVGDAAVLLQELLKHERAAATSMTAELNRTLAPDWKDPPLEGAWTTPEATLAEQITAAQGMLEERFAFCQTMALDQFLAVADGLKPCGYRPICFRPYSVGEKVQVAAVWTRDGRPWELAANMSAERIRRLDVMKRAEGYVPQDVACYLPGAGQQRPSAAYGTLWTRPDAQVTEAKLFVDIPETASHSAEWQQLERAEFFPRTQTALELEGRTWRCAVWCKSKTVVQKPSYAVGQDRHSYEMSLSPSRLLTDVRFAMRRRPIGLTPAAVMLTFGNSPQAGFSGFPWLTPGIDRTGSLDETFALEYSAVWRPATDYLSVESHGLAPEAHRARSQDLTREGYRPVAISVLYVASNRPLVTASVWHKPVIPEAATEALAKRQARAAVTLLKLDRSEAFWPLLAFRPDPTVRTYLIHLLRPFGTEPQVLIPRLKEGDVSAQQAILLALGEFPADALADSAPHSLIPRLLHMYQHDPDPGIHSAVEWLLRRWDQEYKVDETRKHFSHQPPGEHRWYVNGQGQTMVIIPGPTEYWMGSPGSESERYSDEEDLHRVRIPHSFAIATTEVTTEQFQRFLNANPTIKDSFGASLSGDREPIEDVRWTEAAQYCRWLSEQENIPPQEMCYPRVDQITPGIRLPASALARTGYRLPTQEEWEWACRAGTTTSRSFGRATELLVNYAWYSRNSEQHPRPVGQLKPNNFGLFDMYGNVAEWCQDQQPDSANRFFAVSAASSKSVLSDALGNPLCIWRGGSVLTLSSRLRSAAISQHSWFTRAPTGLRIARTQPKAVSQRPSPGAGAPQPPTR